LLRSFTLFLVLPLYLMAALGFFSSNLAFLHRAAFQSYVRIADTPELTVLQFSEDEFEGLNWTEKGREFRWQEMMFDIHSIEKIDGGYVVTCKHDVVESFVVNTLSYLKKGTSKNIPVKKRSRNDFSTKHFAQEILRADLIIDYHKKRSFDSFQKPPLFFNEVKSPPPESLLFS